MKCFSKGVAKGEGKGFMLFKDCCKVLNSVGRSVADVGIVDIEHIGIEKSGCVACSKSNGAPLKNCSGPENRDSSISLGRHAVNLM